MQATQRQFRTYRSLVLTLLTMVVAVAIGCGGRNASQQTHESSLRLVAVLYRQYLSAHGGKAPHDEGEFKVFVRSLGPGVLERAGFSGVDELFVSVRDGMPFAIKYQVGNWPLEGAIAYEQVGINGTRCVATELGSVSELTEVQFQNRHKQPL